MAVIAEEDVLGLEISVNDTERVEVLEGDKDLRRKEAHCLEREAVVRLAAEEGVEVAA